MSSNEGSLIPICTASNGTLIGVVKGGKSLYNFRVRYQEPGKRVRTPRHMHIIIDLYMKLVGNDRLTMKLVDHVIHTMIPQIVPAASFPPHLQVFEPRHYEEFRALDGFGEYPTDFLLLVTELIQIQEKTNYPAGRLNLELFQLFRQRADIFSVVSAATFR